MTDFNEYIGMSYDRDTFNCWHFVHKVLSEVYGHNLPTSPVVDILKPLGTLVDEPVEGCVVLMYDPATRTPDHAGVYIGGNRVLHNHGPSFGVINSHFRALQRSFLKVECYVVNCDTL